MQYFNSGVLLFNLAVWRENKLTQKIADYIRDNVARLRFCDQEALNIFLSRGERNEENISVNSDL